MLSPQEILQLHPFLEEEYGDLEFLDSFEPVEGAGVRYIYRTPHRSYINVKHLGDSRFSGDEFEINHASSVRLVTMDDGNASIVYHFFKGNQFRKLREIINSYEPHEGEIFFERIVANNNDRMMELMRTIGVKPPWESLRLEVDVQPTYISYLMKPEGPFLLESPTDN